MLSQDDDRKIEKAVGVMIDALRLDNNKTKPVIMHSLRVGMYLYNQDYRPDTLIAAFLHDTVEASNLKPSEIQEQFGEDVAALVAANTNDESIEDKVEQYKDTFRRCMERGKEALSIKGSDLLDNLTHQWSSEKDPEKRRNHLEKVRYFLDLTSERLTGTQVWADLHREYLAARAPGE